MNDDRLRRRVIAFFFLGLSFMVGLTIAVGWAWGRASSWGVFDFGWANQVIGFLLSVSGLALVLGSVRIQYRLGKGTPAPRVATQNLVTQGPYAYTRNPMTLGALLLYLGIGVWSGSGIVLILVLVVFCGLLIYIYKHETRELTERFGGEYLAYKSRTPFLWPRIRSQRR